LGLFKGFNSIFHQGETLMTQQNNCSRQAERGFTLVELAIVMIIIGLLIGGILKGQELIANARVTATVSQIKNIDAALSTFQDQYSGYPGDLLNPAQRLPNCTVALCNTAGNGDNRIQSATPNNPGVAVAVSESARAFAQLAAAGIIGGVQASPTGIAVGQTNPESESSGVMSLGYANGILAATGQLPPAPIPSGHYVVNLATVADAAGVGSMTAKTAGAIDGKLDDNNPLTGSVVAGGLAACQVAIGGTNVYNSSVTGNNCSLFARIQQ
jgi:prepilin-type N-terminal cleavage/methylation domain-containing protein